MYLIPALYTIYSVKRYIIYLLCDLRDFKLLNKNIFYRIYNIILAIMFLLVSYSLKIISNRVRVPCVSGLVVGTYAFEIYRTFNEIS